MANVETERTFDPTMAYTFFGSWYEMICELETNADRESLAYNWFKAISEYALYDAQPNFTDPRDRGAWRAIEKEIDISIARRRRGCDDDTPTKKQQKVLDIFDQDPTLSIRALAKIAGVGKSTAEVALKRYRKEARCLICEDTNTESVPEREDAEDNDVEGEREKEAEEDNDIEEEREKEADTDNTGTGQAGQYGETEKPSIPLLEKVLDYLWSKYGYGSYIAQIDDEGKASYDFLPAFYYTPKSNHGQIDDDNGELPF